MWKRNGGEGRVRGEGIASKITGESWYNTDCET